MKSTLYFSTASVLLVATWVLYFLLWHDPLIGWLAYTGWAILAVGLMLIVLAMATLRSKGRPGKGESFTQTTAIVDSGVYAIVRHPLYLGWLLMYVAVMLFSQHWLVVLMGLLGIVCMHLIYRDEDRHLIEKFGDGYREYMQAVPALNIVLGVIRRLR